MLPRTVLKVITHLNQQSTFYNVYGPTECTIISTHHIVRVSEDLTLQCIGRPAPNYSCFLFDEYLQPVPPSATAELYVGGPGVFSGYFNRDDLTKQVLIDIPGVVDGKCYKTGDLVKLDSNGELYFV
ncbi:unnamed protein product, partial [Didymodactylos carnosus]